MKPRTSPERDRVASRSELIRMGGAGVCLLLVVWFVFRPQPSPSAVDQPVQALGSEGPRVNMDARAIAATLERRAREEAGEAAVVSSGAFQLDPTAFEGIDDSALEVVEEPAFYQLVALLHHMPDGEVEQAAAKYGSFEWGQLHARDRSGIERARGKFTTVRGRFITRLFQRVLVRYPNEAGLAWVWQGTFGAENRGYFVTITDKDFEPVPGPYGTPVDLTGAFLRIYRYQPEDEGLPVKSLPHLVVKRMKRVEAGLDIRSHYPSFVGWIMGGVLAVTLVALLLHARGRKGGDRSQEWMKAQQRKRLERAARGPALAAPEPAAPSQAAPSQAAPSQAAPSQAAPSPTAPAPTAPAPAAPAPAATAPVATEPTAPTPSGPSDPAPAPLAAPTSEAGPASAAAAPVPCPGCAQPVAPGGERVVCGACLRQHHRACWQGTCAGCGGAEGLVPLSQG